MTASSAVIRFDKSFFADNGEVVFPGNEENIRTRLGDGRVEIALDPPGTNPFDGGAIERLALSVRWLGDVAIPQDPIAVTEIDGGFEFSIGGRRFRYDRLGLRQA